MVTKTQAWNFASSEPSGTLTIGSGDDRTMIMVQMTEHVSDFSASAAVGGQSATSYGDVYWEGGGDDDLILKYWYWDESTLQSMVGNTVSYADAQSLTKTVWGYATFSSCDQTAPVVVTDAFSADVSGDGLAISTVSNAEDWTIVTGVRLAAGRDFTAWDTLSEILDSSDYGSFRAGLGDGAGGDNSTLVQGDSIGAEMLLQALVVKATSGAGAGNINSTVPTVDGSGDVGINALKAAVPVVAGVGERIIYWTPSVVQLVPPGPTQVTNADIQLSLGDAELFQPIATIAGVGSRGFPGIGALSAPSGTASGGINTVRTGSGALTAPVAEVDTSFAFFSYIAAIPFATTMGNFSNVATSFRGDFYVRVY